MVHKSSYTCISVLNSAQTFSSLIGFQYIFVSFCILVYSVAFRILVYFVSLRLVSHFSIFRCVIFRFVSFRFVRFRFVVQYNPVYGAFVRVTVTYFLFIYDCMPYFGTYFNNTSYRVYTVRILCTGSELEFQQIRLRNPHFACAPVRVTNRSHSTYGSKLHL